MADIVFVGDWVKDRVLGSGSFGVVTLWKHKRTDEKLALKICKWGDELTAKHKERWTKEVEMLLSCNNQNIVGTKELPSEFVSGLIPANPSNLPILCMEYCSGGDLRQLLNKPEYSSGLNEIQVRHILSDLCNAMQFLHNNKITHRDLKPENIVMQVLDSPVTTDLSGQGHRKTVYKLIDLGYAKELDSQSICASFVGTLQYLAPEIFYSKTYSNSVDFWSLGLVAFEIICGTRPFLPHLAPVQWMPNIKKKTHEHICVYQTFHGDIEYSNEIIPENHISRPLQSLLEKWLQIALEWDPKLRGRDSPSKVTFNIPTEANELSSKVILFTLLEEILSKNIIIIYSVSTISQIAYEIDQSTTIAKLKNWINKDTKIPVQHQVLISQTSCKDINNDELVVQYWNDQGKIMLYLYDSRQILQENIEPVVPKAVQRCLEHPKSLYNYNNSQVLYRNGLYFVLSQMQAYDSLITSLCIRAESIKQESKQLLLKHNNADKDIVKLMTKHETVIKIIDTGKSHIENLRQDGTGTNFLGGFDKIFKDSDELNEKISKLTSAWAQLNVRLQSAVRRSNEVLTADLGNFVSKYNYQSLYIEAQKAYIYHKKNETGKRKEIQCHDIMKICYNCLKLRSKILLEIKHQPFVLKLLDLSVECSKISEIINVAAENTEKLIENLSTITDELNECMWTTISMLSSEEMADLPYSVVSFQKRDFRIGDVVTTNCGTLPNGTDDEVKTLIEESLKIRQNHVKLSDTLKKQREMLSESLSSFSLMNNYP